MRTAAPAARANPAFMEGEKTPDPRRTCSQTEG
jgi:hypothetical protein